MTGRIDLHVDRVTVHSAGRIDGEALAEALRQALHAAFSSGLTADPAASGRRHRIRVQAAPGPRAVADAVALSLLDTLTLPDTLGGAPAGRHGDADGTRSGAPDTPLTGDDAHE